MHTRPADIRVFLAAAGLENAEDVDLTDSDCVEWRGAGPEALPLISARLHREWASSDHVAQVARIGIP
ncbi:MULTISPECIES: hypothetical protein [unclassified Streptomyces]|uniref:hypothetical protein n=1 Tax=unclassified Streptomyces TaxID=2593676 RepID=UPI002E35A6B3|nr:MULTISPECIES: hypothetical protein [unclassified Streptomyces]